MKLSVVVPVYNERETILAVLEAVRAHPVEGVAYEVVVVDDGSTDGTGALLETRPELYTQLLRLPRNGGKGAAVKAGLQAAPMSWWAAVSSPPATPGCIISGIWSATGC